MTYDSPLTVTNGAAVGPGARRAAPAGTAHAQPAIPADQAARWTVASVAALYELPFNDLLFKAQQVHREHFDPNLVQLSTLLSIKTGGCPEDCAYCPQSAHYDTGVDADKLMPLDDVLQAARDAKAHGATRFCMGAAWRSPKDHHLEQVAQMVRGVKSARPRDLRDPRHAEGGAGRIRSRTPGSTTTTTISIRRPSSTARSSARGPTRTGSTRSTTCATRASTSAAAGSSAWGNRGANAPG